MDTKLIDKIVDDFFTNGQGKRAARLVLVDKDGKDLGGWSDRAISDRIKRTIKEHEKRKAGKR